MSAINKEAYAKLNRALNELEDLFGCMGIRELSLAGDKRLLKIDTSADNLDTDLINNFCHNIDQIHARKFGHEPNA